MVNPKLPQEILVDIFSRLPAKSVGKCRCLAKPWRTLLSSPEFVKSHFTQQPHHENLILITPSRSIHSVNGAASRVLHLPGNSSVVVGSCNGLVLLVDDEQTKLLVNPVTLEHLIIPDSPLAIPKRESFSMHGFGYDILSNDYKIVTLSHYDTDNEYGSECDDIFVDVYSVKRGVWTRVDCSPYDHTVAINSSGVFINGAIHWLASTDEWVASSSGESGYPSVITAFNLEDEEFDEIPPPTDLDVNKFVFYSLAVFGGCLCMIDNRSNTRRPDIWIMEEYGVGDSWTKLSVDANYGWDIIKPLCYIGDDEIALLTEEETLVVYNLKEKTLRDMLVDGVPSGYIDGCAFVESLVAPAGGRV